jgi:hypothetical protein
MFYCSLMGTLITLKILILKANRKEHKVRRGRAQRTQRLHTAAASCHFLPILVSPIPRFPHSPIQFSNDRLQFTY